MSGTDCGSVRELIPDVGTERADDVAVRLVTEHVATCADCAAELDLVRSLFASRAGAPVDLSASVLRRARRQGRSLRRPWWGISAAAVAALALGIGISGGPPGSDPTSVEGVEMVVDAEADEFWLADDGILAGAPVFEAMSDEALSDLLDELSTLQGGQA